MSRGYSRGRTSAASNVAEHVVAKCVLIVPNGFLIRFILGLKKPN